MLAREHLERAIEQLTPCPGVRWEIETARTLLHDTLFWMGDWKRLFDEIPARRQEAEDCGDLYSATHVAVRLAADRASCRGRAGARARGSDHGHGAVALRRISTSSTGGRCAR